MMITDRELPENLVHNLDLILPCRSLEHYERFADVEGVLSFLLDRIRAAPTEPLGTVCSSTDYELDLEPGSCLVLVRSEEHTSELQSLMRTSYAVFCLQKKKPHRHNINQLTVHLQSTTHNI